MPHWQLGCQQQNLPYINEHTALCNMIEPIQANLVLIVHMWRMQVGNIHTGIPVRAFRRFKDGKDNYFVYDGLYFVVSWTACYFNTPLSMTRCWHSQAVHKPDNPTCLGSTQPPVRQYRQLLRWLGRAERAKKDMSSSNSLWSVSQARPACMTDR